MRGVLSILAVWMLGALTVPGLEESGDAPDAPAKEGRGPVIAWDQPSTDVSGEEETLDHGEVVLTDLETDLRTGGAIAARAETPIQAGPNEADLGALFPSQPPGKVRVWIRAVDRDGNVSDWGGPLEVEFRRKAAEEGPEPRAEEPQPPAPQEEPMESGPVPKDPSRIEPPSDATLSPPAEEPPAPAPEVEAPESPREVPRGRPLLPQQSRGGGCRLF